MKNCIVCQGAAEVFCFQDEAYLCLDCDAQVHSANVLARRHHRTKVCELCTSAPSTVFCKNDKAHLCGPCDVEAHTGIVNSRHERVPVTPSAQADASEGNSQAKAADALSEKNLDDATDDSLWAVPDVSTEVVPAPAEEPDWNNMSLPMDAKALLGEEFQQEMDIFDMDPTWMDRLDMGFDDLTDSLLDDFPLGADAKAPLRKAHAPASSDTSNSWAPPCVPNFAPGKARLTRATSADILDTADLISALQSAPLQQQQAFQHLAAEPVQQQHMVPMHAALPAPAQQDQQQQQQKGLPQVQAAPAPRVAAPMPPPLAYHPPAHASDHRYMTSALEVERLDVSTYVPRSLQPCDAATLVARAADRRLRLDRFREKKKNRHFKKTIRYASRKAYAEVRPRIKGRFARKDEVVAMRAAGILPQLVA